ncbi:MAG: citrate synthase [Ilumatobacteraceae bacterium]
MAWLTTAQAAHRLGVKPATLYAYVSRELLHSHRALDGRGSRFDAREVEQLALRGRPRLASRPVAMEIRIQTAITRIDDHRFGYRGHDALALATTASFEQVAELLWSGRLPAATAVWESAAVQVSTQRAVDRMRLAAAHAGIGAPRERDFATVTGEGRRLIATLVEALPPTGDGRCPRLHVGQGAPVRGSIAGRLWVRLTPRRATPQLLNTLNAALVLLADHEMAASTLAARVAASTRANVHGVIAAGMGALSGPFHGGESERCRRLLQRAGAAPVGEVVDDALERHGRLPGFGQVLYPRGDPRAALLLSMLRAAGPHPTMDLIDRVIASARRRALPPPNVDLALASLGAVAGMPFDAGEVIFTPARVVGWLAHALEEYDERPLRFRPRAEYVGD